MSALTRPLAELPGSLEGASRLGPSWPHTLAETLSASPEEQERFDAGVILRRKGGARQEEKAGL